MVMDIIIVFIIMARVGMPTPLIHGCGKPHQKQIPDMDMNRI